MINYLIICLHFFTFFTIPLVIYLTFRNQKAFVRGYGSMPFYGSKAFGQVVNHTAAFTAEVGMNGNISIVPHVFIVNIQCENSSVLR